MTSINFTRSNAASDSNDVFRMDVTINSAEGITPNLFVKQRVLDLNGNPNDTFVTVANVVDIEDYGQGAPHTDETLFLTNTVSLLSNDLSTLDRIFTEMTSLLQKVCTQNDELADLTSSQTFIVNSAGITVDS